ncbi:glycosyltransferase family 2 protein [Labrys sp. KB_33_2]|uniref:glycosyltransferase n=1 Tax=Labrys sp. KB_33_2 TaxID=3237479 RepID=UPI003F8FA6F8
MDSALVSLLSSLPGHPQQHEEMRPAVIAIPACNEEERISRCLAALAVQRDKRGQRIPFEAYQVLVYANNCTDATAARAADIRNGTGVRIDVVSVTCSEELSSAGLARKAAMDIAAEQLETADLHNGVILTTDADSIVSPSWLASSWQEFSQGADCIAGYIDADPHEFIELGRSFQYRGFFEEHYHALVAEIFALLDPRPHDPWPNHQVSSGASLAVTLKMYRAIGGLPAKATGEDAALALAVECLGGKVRHSMDVCVTTSCRLDGRAVGGAADAMKQRHAEPDAPCDQELESVFAVTKKAWLKGHLRRSSNIGFMEESAVLAALGLGSEEIGRLLTTLRRSCFEVFWQELSAASTFLRYGEPLRPSMLAAEIRRAEILLTFLRSQPNPLEAIDLLMEDRVAFEARLQRVQE